MNWESLKRDEQGSVTIVGAGVIAVLCTTTVLCIRLGLGVADSHQARNAADLAAVSGAFNLFSGSDVCGAAERIARTNKAELSDCEIVGEDVIVTVTVRESTATARAGPL